MFVTVMSRRTDTDRRASIRQMWEDAHEGWGTMQYFFAICDKPGTDSTEDPVDVMRLQQELEEHRDVMQMDCVEGYLNGHLTRKVLAAMRIYKKIYSKAFDLFMKTDDDTFISPKRLCDFMTAQPANVERFSNSYAGVFAEEDERMKEGQPCRDPSSDWYEPEDKYPDENYPVSAKGGPGYILGKKLITKMINAGIPDRFILNNEDKAVGVWMNELSKMEPVNLVNLPGTDGYDEYHPAIHTTGTWRTYPYAIHHHLKGVEIDCLFRIDKARDDHYHIDSCFDPSGHRRDGEPTTQTLRGLPQPLRPDRDGRHIHIVEDNRLLAIDADEREQLASCMTGGH